MSLVQYKCPNCGGSLEFAPQSQKYECQYCMSAFTKEQIDEIFAANEANPLTDADGPASNGSDFCEHTALYTCNSCGAEIIAEDNTSATFCYYCKSPVILTGRLSNEYRPARLIPFKLTKDDAVAEFKKMCEKRWFLPSSFKSQSQLDSVTGVYVPYWLADCNANGSMTALAKKERSWTSGDTRYTNTKEYRCVRTADFKFKGIPADASSKFPDDLMEAIEPFDYTELKDFSMSYLSGFMADKYDVDKASVFSRIKARLTGGAIKLMDDTITGYTSVEVEQSNVNIMSTKWNYILLPVWFMTYSYAGKKFFYALNGQTRKISGELPVSKAKMLLTAAAAAVVTFIVSMIVGGIVG